VSEVVFVVQNLPQQPQGHYGCIHGVLPHILYSTQLYRCKLTGWRRSMFEVCERCQQGCTDCTGFHWPVWMHRWAPSTQVVICVLSVCSCPLVSFNLLQHSQRQFGCTSEPQALKPLHMSCFIFCVLTVCYCHLWCRAQARFGRSGGQLDWLQPLRAYYTAYQHGCFFEEQHAC
jgi:hypothetical protein